MQISVRTEIEKRLMNALNPFELAVIDDSAKHKGHLDGGAEEGTHFRVKVISAFFKGMPRIERHKVVHGLLKDLLENQIHALSLTLLSDDE
jgi:BolA protein